MWRGNLKYGIAAWEAEMMNVFDSADVWDVL